MKGKHLTASDRIEIECGLKQGKSFTEISSVVDKTISTIRNEIILHREIKYPTTFNGQINTCAHFKDDSCTITSLCNIDSCNKNCKSCRKHLCNSICKYYEEYICERLKQKPYCCNGCPSSQFCHNIKMVYTAKTADLEYHNKLENSRKGHRISEKDVEYINKNVKPRIKNGQSFSNIKMSDKNISVSIATLYNYTNDGVFDFKNIDLPKKIQYKARKNTKDKESTLESKQNEITLLKSSRDYIHFIQHTEKHPNQTIVEMDTVIGRRNGGKVLLTLIFRKSNLMIAFLLNDKKAKTVNKKLDYLKNKIKPNMFIKLFKIILTDNGVEFSMIEEIETIETKKKIHLFFCDPGKSNQKGKIEKNHVEIRKILPKGTSFDNLTQADINKMMSHINSYKRKKLGNISPYQAFVNEYGKQTTDSIMNLLNYKLIKDEDIILKPKLLSKNK